VTPAVDKPLDPSDLSSTLSKISKHCLGLFFARQRFTSSFTSALSFSHPGMLSFGAILVYDWWRLSLSLALTQKTEQFLLLYLVLCAASSVSCDFPVPRGPIIANIVDCLSLKSFASSSASCTS
jgi:hypothetical protein